MFISYIQENDPSWMGILWAWFSKAPLLLPILWSSIYSLKALHFEKNIFSCPNYIESSANETPFPWTIIKSMEMWSLWLLGWKIWRCLSKISSSSSFIESGRYNPSSLMGKPADVKPYWYPYFQKQVMERILPEMLKELIIMTSTRSFPLMYFLV